MNGLRGKVILVMGGGADGPPAAGERLAIGNGRAIALLCARLGASVAVADRNLAAAQETESAIASEGGVSVAVSCDVSDDRKCQEAVRAVLAAFGRLDGLVNNVGIVDATQIEACAPEKFTRFLSVNVAGHFNAIRHALPVMRATGGSIVNIASVAGIRSVGLGVGYDTSKAAILGLTRNVAVHAGAFGVRVNTVLPGTINSTILRRYRTEEQLQGLSSGIPLRRLGTPWDVAKATAFLLSDDASYITGADLIVDGGAAVTMAGV